MTRIGGFDPNARKPTAEHEALLDRLRATVRSQGPQLFQAPCEEVMAIDPPALARAFMPGFFGAEAPSFARVGGLGVVDVAGPLMQKAGWLWDGYDAIVERFAAAMMDTSVKAVVLKLDSPGGMCAGLFEAVDTMKALAAQSKKPVLAYAGEMAASAAYALASVASEIWLPKSGIVGSVGTVITLAEQSESLAKAGIRVAVIATGTQKTDGHPAIALTDEVIARFRARADYLNAMFVGQVAASRDMTTAKVLALEAGVFYGEAAVKAGLADHVGSYAEFLKVAESKTKVTPPRAASAARSAVEVRNMEDEKNQAAPSGAALLTLIAATIGMVACSTERDVQVRARELADTERDLVSATGKTNAAEALGTVKAWRVSHDTLGGVQKELAELRAQETSRELDGLIDQAKASGKIANEQLEATCRAIGAASPLQLRSLLATLPSVGGGTMRGAGTREPEVAVALSAEDMVTARQLGIDPDDLAKQRRDETARKAG